MAVSSSHSVQTGFFPRTPGFTRFIDQLFKRHPNGFYMYLPKESRITSTDKIGGYDGKTVMFWYGDNDGVKRVVSVGVFEFIEVLIQHIPDRQFKMIRYYGVYARRWKSRFNVYVQESITQSKLDGFPKNRDICCPVCGKKMDFVMYWKTGPPSKCVFGQKIGDWSYLSVSVDAV